jgi:hypothetical protein
MAAAHLHKAFNKIKDQPSDSPLTIPIGINSKAADANIASSAKETKKTCHIQYHYHYFRESTQRGSNKLFHTLGLDNLSIGLTKPEAAVNKGIVDLRCGNCTQMIDLEDFDENLICRSECAVNSVMQIG